MTFTTTGVYAVRLTGVDESGMLAVEDDTVQVTVECPTIPPAGVVENLELAREAGQIRFTWTNLSMPPADYVVLSSDAPAGPYLPQGAATNGVVGLLLPEPTGNAYYKVAARNETGCLGPY